MLKQIWETWKLIARAVGTFQARALLTVFYAVLVLPFGIFTRLFSDPLRIKSPPDRWSDHPDEPYDLQWAKRQ